MFVAALLALPLFAGNLQMQSAPLTLIRSGISHKLGGSGTAVFLSSKKPGNLQVAPRGVTNLRYATAIVGGQRVLIALGKKNGVDQLFVDANEDGDLSNDPPVTWRPKSARLAGAGTGRFAYHFQGHSALCSFQVTQSSASQLIITPDFGLSGSITLGRRDIRFLLVSRTGEPLSGAGLERAQLALDRSGDGQFSGPGREYSAAAPFTINGTSLQLSSVDLEHGIAHFTPAEAVAEVPLDVELADHQKAPSFSAMTLDDKVVEFPGNGSDKVVLIYVWASWSKPSLDFEEKLQKAYQTYHASGLGILGVCLDTQGQRDAAKSAASAMPWANVFDGKSWNGAVPKLLHVKTLPYLVLVDCRTGETLATMSDLVGDKFESTIAGAVRTN